MKELLHEYERKALNFYISGRPIGLSTIMTRVSKQGTRANHRCVGCLLLTSFLLWALSGCGSAAPEFPPTEEMVQTAAAELGWALNPEETQSWAEEQVLYTFECEDQTRASVSCALAEETRFLTENCVVTLLPDKPQFAWEDWKEAVMLAETLYGGFSEEELYQTLSGQEMPELEIPSEGPDTPTGRESLGWEVELPAGYGRVQWSVSEGTVEHNFPSPVIQDWRVLFTISLYESREAYEGIGAVSE